MAKKKTAKKRPAKKKATAKRKKKSTKKKPVNKSEAIRAYFKTHKTAGAKEVQAALARKGITVSEGLVNNVKSNAKKKKKKTARKKVKVRVVKKAAERSPIEDVKEAGSLMLKAVELVISAGAAEAKQLIGTASEIVNKARTED